MRDLANIIERIKLVKNYAEQHPVFFVGDTSLTFIACPFPGTAAVESPASRVLLLTNFVNLSQ